MGDYDERLARLAEDYYSVAERPLCKHCDREATGPSGLCDECPTEEPGE